MTYSTPDVVRRCDRTQGLVGVGKSGQRMTCNFCVLTRFDVASITL
jgi:hypothetical protein